MKQQGLTRAACSVLTASSSPGFRPDDRLPRQDEEEGEEEEEFIQNRSFTREVLPIGGG